MALTKTPEDSLFKRAPKDVKELNLRSRREARAKQRAQWAAENPTNWRLQRK